MIQPVFFTDNLILSWKIHDFMREGRFISLLFLHGKPTSRVIAASIELTVFPIRKHNDGDKILFRQLQCLGKAFYVTVVLVKRVMERILVVSKVLIPSSPYTGFLIKCDNMAKDLLLSTLYN